MSGSIRLWAYRKHGKWSYTIPFSKFLKMSISDNVIRKTFVNLEHFLHKVAGLDVFEVLIFNYKIKIGLSDPLTVNFLAIISELSDELTELLKDNEFDKNDKELPTLVNDVENTDHDDIPPKVEEEEGQCRDIPLVLSFCHEAIDDKSLELVEAPVTNDIESQEYIVPDSECEDFEKHITTVTESKKDCSQEESNAYDNVPESLIKEESSTGKDEKSEVDVSNTIIQEKNNVCRFCNRKFLSSSKLVGHVAKCPKSKANATNNKCSQCDLSFSSIRLLSCHMTESHGKSNSNGGSTEDPAPCRVGEVQSLPENLPFYCCRTCLFVYKTSVEFETHSCKEVSENTETEGYVGDYFYVLGKYLVSNPDLLARMRKFRCGTCCEEYRSLNRMLYHLSRCTQGPYSCELCQIECASKRELNHHKKKTHRDANCFFCDECGLAFKLRASLQKHKVNRHERSTGTTCEQCNLTFSKRIQLTNHMIREHQVERKFLCQVCGNKFSTHSSLMAHLSSHSGQFRFSCSFCNKKFRQKEKLKFHTRIHTGERPHLCPTCGKGFIRKSKLDDHIRRHRGEKQYQCSMCSKCYASSWDLKLHMRKQHSEENGVVNVETCTLNISESVVSEIEQDDSGEVTDVGQSMSLISTEQAAELQELPEDSTLTHLRELPLATSETTMVDSLAPNDGKLLLHLDPSQVPNTLMPSSDSVGTRLLLQLAQNGDPSSRILVQLDGSQVAHGGQTTLLPSTILTVADTLQLTPVVDDLNLNLGAVSTQYLHLAPAPGSTAGTAGGGTSTATAMPVHIQLPVSAVPVPATAISQAQNNGTNPYGLQPVPVQAVFTPAGFNVNGMTY